MNPNNQEPQYVRIGLLDKTLGVRREAQESEPVIATARDIGELLTAFQKAVHAQYAFERGWDSVHPMRPSDRARLALQIDHLEKSSFLEVLTAAQSIDPATLYLLILTTIQTLATVAQLALMLRSHHPQEIKPDDKRKLDLMKWPATGIAEVSLRSNHVVSVSLDGHHFSATLENSIAIQRYSRRSPAPRTSDLPDLAFREEVILNGIVQSIDPTDRSLRVYSHEYRDIVRCSDATNYILPFGDLREGARLSLRGTAMRLKRDAPDSSPLLLQLEELLATTPVM